MGLFDKLKKKAQEQIESAGMSDILQNQKDAFRYAMKNGGFSLLGSDREEKLAAFRAQEEAEKKAKEDAKRLELERIEAERLAKIEAERKAKEEADRMVVEEARRKAEAAAEARAIEEAERLAKIESERRIQEEMDRKAIEEAQRRIKVQADLRALEETERKLKEEEQQRLAEAQKQQDKVLDPIREYVEKAESGDAQAACQIGLWFQHGQKGLPCDKEQAKYWYQQAMVLGNPNAASFLNMLIDEEKKEAGIKAQEKTERIAQEAAEEVARQKQEEEKRKRLMYNSEDEYLANEKQDGNASLNVALRLFNKLDDNSAANTCNIPKYEEVYKYLKFAEVYGVDKDNEGMLQGIKLSVTAILDTLQKIAELEVKEKRHNAAISELSDGLTHIWDDTFRELDEKKEKEIDRKKDYVNVVFKYSLIMKTSGNEERRVNVKELPKEEYYSLMRSGQEYLENYVLSEFIWNKDSYYCRDISMTTQD